MAKPLAHQPMLHQCCCHITLNAVQPLVNLVLWQAKKHTTIGVLNTALKQVKHTGIARDRWHGFATAIHMQTQKRLLAVITHLMNKIVVYRMHHSW